MEAVKKDIGSLEFADESLKKDMDIIMKFTNQYEIYYVVKELSKQILL